MAYVKTTWSEGVTKVGPTNMNHLEGGVETADITATAAIAKSVGTTTGDIIYFSAASTPARLALGAAGTVLHGGASAPAWSALTIAELSGYPSDATKFARGDGTWAVPASTGPTIYRKVTAKTVNTTVTKTDLLNGEFTLAANDLGTNKRATLRASGDWKQNSGGAAVTPRIVFDLGGTTILDTGAFVSSGTAANSATRYGWWVEVVISETGATNSQSVRMRGEFSEVGTAVTETVAFTTGEGTYTFPAGGGIIPFLGWNSATKDGTGTLAIALSTINGSASANYEVVLKDAMLVVE